jgi:hypothetical protein
VNYQALDYDAGAAAFVWLGLLRILSTRAFKPFSVMWPPRRRIEQPWGSWHIWKSIRRHRLGEEPQCRKCAIRPKLAWPAAVYAECRESLLCELNCELTGMAKRFSELNVIPKGVAALLNFRS